MTPEIKKELELRKQKNKEIAKLHKEATEIIIKRSGQAKKNIVEAALKRFVTNNIELLTPAEKKKYKSVLPQKDS